MRLRRGPATSAGEQGRVDSQLNILSAQRSTGVLIVRAPAATVSIYAFEGGIYAAHVEGFSPRHGQRMISSGWIPTESIDESLEELVATTELTPEQAAVVHQESMLATIDALRQLPEDQLLDVSFNDGQMTDRGCTLPVEVSALLALCAARNERARDDLRSLGVAGETIAAAAGLGISARNPAAIDVPEIEAFTAALLDSGGAPRAIDEVAAHCGFTRAEALHLARRLHELDHVEVHADVPHVGEPLVPEAAISASIP